MNTALYICTRRGRVRVIRAGRDVRPMPGRAREVAGSRLRRSVIVVSRARGVTHVPPLEGWDGSVCSLGGATLLPRLPIEDLRQPAPHPHAVVRHAVLHHLARGHDGVPPTVIPPHTTAFPPTRVRSPTIAGLPGSRVGSRVRSSSPAPGPRNAPTPSSQPGSIDAPSSWRAPSPTKARGWTMLWAPTWTRLPILAEA